MLDEDGLCRIQRNTSEEMLCNTCRKFPRLTAAINGDIWISLAASCPAVSRYLLHDSVEWITLQGERICLEDLSVWKEGKSALQLLSAAYPHEDPDFDSFVNVSMECLDIILAFPECRYLEDSFDFYEWENDEAACDLIRRFVANTGQWWKQYYDNYMRYRILSRYLEYPQEMNTERIHQVLGELLLLRVICCSRVCLSRISWGTGHLRCDPLGLSLFGTRQTNGAACSSNVCWMVGSHHCTGSAKW